MAPEIETTAGDIGRFYDRIAPEYDEMTALTERFVQERPFIRLLVERNAVRTALDAGCGSGFHALLLAELGVEVHAVDVSAAMVERLHRHAGQRGVKVTAVQTSLDRLRTTIPTGLDAIFCMGNTLAHLLSADERLRVLGEFAAVLRPGGLLVAQVLNFQRIMGARQKVQHVREVGDVIFLRSYEYHDPFVEFNIFRLRRQRGSITHEVDSVRLLPIYAADLSAQLEASGFADIGLHGSIATDGFVPETSRDLVVLAHRRTVQ